MPTVFNHEVVVIGAPLVEEIIYRGMIQQALHSRVDDALAVVLARRLQLGDPGGDLRHALAQFPIPDVSARVLADYFDTFDPLGQCS